jgi:hypothetical protein
MNTHLEPPRPLIPLTFLPPLTKFSTTFPLNLGDIVLLWKGCKVVRFVAESKCKAAAGPVVHSK